VMLRQEQADEIRLAGMEEAVRQVGAAILARFSRSRFPTVIVVTTLETGVELVVTVVVLEVIVTLVAEDTMVVELVVRCVEVVFVVDGTEVVVDFGVVDIAVTTTVLVVFGVTVLVYDVLVPMDR
jgi:hypothetical protein